MAPRVGPTQGGQPAEKKTASDPTSVGSGLHQAMLTLQEAETEQAQQLQREEDHEDAGDRLEDRQEGGQDGLEGVEEEHEHEGETGDEGDACKAFPDTMQGPGFAGPAAAGGLK